MSGSRTTCKPRRRLDVFNGDADGICALHQLRLAEPAPAAETVTGVKRDIQLLARLTGLQGAELTVLDISLDRNRDALLSLLQNRCRVLYIDHHYAGEIPAAAHLVTHIDPDPGLCTALIVDRLLAGRFRAWAVVGAFGDNLHQAAGRAAAELALSETELLRLRELGELFNYNGYGSRLEDLHFHPAELYHALSGFVDPLDFCRQSPLLADLRDGFAQDITRARREKPHWQGPGGRVFHFPAEPWARRVAGVFCNELARARPEQAHALLVDNDDGTLLVSVRAPQSRPAGADALCRAFPTGGGRAGAAGINALPAVQHDRFLQSFAEAFKP